MLLLRIAAIFPVLAQSACSNWVPPIARRLMLIATCGITVAAFARFPDWLMPDNFIYVGVDGLLLAAIAWEWLFTRRVHPVYRYGLPALVMGQGLTMWIFLS